MEVVYNICNKKRKNMAEIIIGIYKITNTVTGDFYIGSSKNIENRWINHKCPSTWKRHPNNPMYLDIQKYGTDKFVFEILEEVEITHLKEKEQQFIEKMHPTYNSYNAKGLDVDKYDNQLCRYNSETLTLNALRKRFKKSGIEHPTIEAKKYLVL